MTRAHRTSEEMFPLIEAYLSGHLTQKDFCLEHELPISVFCYWLRKHRSASSEPGSFLEITPEATSHSERPLLEVCYPHGVRLRIFAPLRPADLDRLLGRT
jgi:hypothetical protein